MVESTYNTDRRRITLFSDKIRIGAAGNIFPIVTAIGYLVCGCRWDHVAPPVEHHHRRGGRLRERKEALLLLLLQMMMMLGVVVRVAAVAVVGVQAVMLLLLEVVLFSRIVEPLAVCKFKKATCTVKRFLEILIELVVNEGHLMNINEILLDQPSNVSKTSQILWDRSTKLEKSQKLSRPK